MEEKRESAEKARTETPETRPAPYAAGTGTAALLAESKPLARMSYRERLAEKRGKNNKE